MVTVDLKAEADKEKADAVKAVTKAAEMEKTDELAAAKAVAETGKTEAIATYGIWTIPLVESKR